MGVVVVDRAVQTSDTVQDMVVAHSNRFTTRIALQLNAGCRCTTSTKTDQRCAAHASSPCAVPPMQLDPLLASSRSKSQSYIRQSTLSSPSPSFMTKL